MVVCEAAAAFRTQETWCRGGESYRASLLPRPKLFLACWLFPHKTSVVWPAVAFDAILPEEAVTLNTGHFPSVHRRRGR
jgi:hypothetical protein